MYIKLMNETQINVTGDIIESGGPTKALSFTTDSNLNTPDLEALFIPSNLGTIEVYEDETMLYSITGYTSLANMSRRYQKDGAIISNVTLR